VNKKITVIPIIIIVIVFAINFSSDSNVEKSNNVFHITLADPNLYTNGVYFDEFTISKGEYSFGFVPNGSSPKILSIKLNGDSFDFSEDFKLEGTLHQAGISEYYTWNYNGERNILISEEQGILISINPNGNVMGSVSVDILEN
jgi:hypothetical protein